MATPNVSASTAAPAINSASSLSFWQSLTEFVMRRRVRIMGLVLLLLVLEDIFEKQLRPRSPLNFTDFYAMLGLVLVMLGIFLRSWAAGTLHKNSEITTSGPYGMVRHPLYIGSFITMLGICFLINDRGENFVMVCGPLLVIFIMRALKEERYLAGKFAAQWNDYKGRVGRFFPRSGSRDAFGSWRWKQWIDNREYRFMSAMLLGLAGLQIWHAIK